MKHWLPSLCYPPFYFLSLRICLHSAPRICKIMQYLSFCDWLVSQSMMSLGLIQLVTGMRISFLLKAGYCSILWIYRILFIHLSVHEALGCFYLLAVVNHDAMHTGVQIPVWIPAVSSFGSIPRSGIVGPHGNSFDFLRNCQTFPKQPHRFTFPPAT